MVSREFQRRLVKERHVIISKNNYLINFQLTKWVCIFLVAFLTGCGCEWDNSCKDDSDTLGTINEAKIQSPAIQKQQTSVWCWAASIQNALSSYGVNTSQEQIVTATYGNVQILPIFDPREAVINLLKENYLLAPQGKVIHPYFVAGPPAPSVLVRELSREKSPILVFYSNPQGGGHVVVCYGVKYSGNESNPTIVEVMVKDPWDATEKTWTGSQLASVWQSTIFLRVAPYPPSIFVYNNVSYSISLTFEALNMWNGLIEGRVWYFNEDNKWHAINLFGMDLGPI